MPDHLVNLDVRGTRRRALVHVPPGADGHTPRPAVVMFHGAGGTAEWTADETGWSDKADAEDFVAVYPEGLPLDPAQPPGFLANPQVWDDGRGHSHRGEPVNDLAFVSALFDELPARWGVDPGRVYVTGFSNGAGMAFRVAVELSQRVAAVAPVAGYLRLDDPRLARAVPTLYLIGADDPLVPLAGGVVTTPWGDTVERPAVFAMLDRWAAAMGCAAAGRVPVSDTDGIHVSEYGGCRDEAVVTVGVIDGLGHHWPGGKGQLSRRVAGPPSDRLRATDLIWDFFRQRRR
jgi:polyhydroxybutyrate depolymerase